MSNGPLGHFDFSGQLNHNLKHSENSSSSFFSSSTPSTTSNAQLTPILKKKIFKHVSAAAPTFSLQKQILLNNAHVYEKGNTNLIHSIIGSKQPLGTNLNAGQETSTLNRIFVFK